MHFYVTLVCILRNVRIKVLIQGSKHYKDTLSESLKHPRRIF